MSGNQVALAYLVASVFFILALKGLSHPLSARRGNRFGIAGMLIAGLVTFAIANRVDMAIGALAVGGVIGAFVARRVQMTQMPELVAAMHSLVGLAAVMIAIAVVNNPEAFDIPFPIPAGNRFELFVGAFIGAITFSGSVIAFGKLAGLGKKFRLFSSAPITFPGQHALNAILALAMLSRHHVLCRRARRAVAAVHRDDGAGLRAGRVDHHPHRWRRHARRGVDAEQLLGLGRGRHRLLA